MLRPVSRLVSQARTLRSRADSHPQKFHRPQQRRLRCLSPCRVELYQHRCPTSRTLKQFRVIYLDPPPSRHRGKIPLPHIRVFHRSCRLPRRRQFPWGPPSCPFSLGSSSQPSCRPCTRWPNPLHRTTTCMARLINHFRANLSPPTFPSPSTRPIISRHSARPLLNGRRYLHQCPATETVVRV
jgi:hypothetical protein